MRAFGEKPRVSFRLAKDKLKQLKTAQKELGAKDRTAIIVSALDDYLGKMAQEGFLSSGLHKASDVR